MILGPRLTGHRSFVLLYACAVIGDSIKFIMEILGGRFVEGSFGIRNSLVWELIKKSARV